MNHHFPNYKNRLILFFWFLKKILFYLFIKYSIELEFLLFKIQVESSFIENEER